MRRPCAGGELQSRESNAAGESGRDVTSGQDVTEKEKIKSTKFACELAGQWPPARAHERPWGSRRIVVGPATAGRGCADK